MPPAPRTPSPLARPLHDRRSLLVSTVGLAGLTGACAAGRDGRRADGEGELSEIFSDLGDQSARWTPISAAEKRPRLARLAGLLRAAQVDALLVEPGATLSYLSGVDWGRSERLFALIVLADGTCFWIAPSFEAPRAARLIAEKGGPEGPLVAWDEHEYAWQPLASALGAHRVERIAIPRRVSSSRSAWPRSSEPSACCPETRSCVPCAHRRTRASSSSCAAPRS